MDWKWGIVLTVLPLLLAQQAHAFEMSTEKVNHYMTTGITVHAKVNGKELTMLLDTGSDFLSYLWCQLSKVGLDKLPSSHILGNTVGMESADGRNDMYKVVDVEMSINGSHSFRTGVVIDPKTQGCPPLLSTHDLLQAFDLKFPRSLFFIIIIGSLLPNIVVQAKYVSSEKWTTFVMPPGLPTAW